MAYEPLTGFHGQGARLGGIEFVAPKRERASGAFPHALPGPIPLWASKRDWLRGFGCQNGSPAARNQSHLARSFHRPPIQKLPTQEREREREGESWQPVYLREQTSECGREREQLEF